MSSTRSRRDIAVIGMSCRYPGANSISEFWEILKNGEDQIRLTPKHRFDLIPGLTEIHGGFIKDPLDEFDAPFFNVTAKEAPFMDPQQRLFLEVALEGLENARIPTSSLRQTNTGIFCGVAFSQYRKYVEPVVNADNSAVYYELMGSGWSSIPGRLAHYLDVTGPNIMAEAGCASSALSLYQAVQSLRLGETNLAIVGGVNLMMDKSIRIPSVILTDRCRAFDSSAKGFAPAEGIGVVILKVLEDAVRDSDPIIGIIRGMALNHNGTTRSLGTPNSKAQTDVIISAMADAQVTPNDITYLEAHGTGTKVGDPTEAEGICRAFESNNRPPSHPLVISSTKTYVGHTLSTSCLVGLTRVLLSMRHQLIPKHLHLANLHPKIDFGGIPGRIPLESCSWHSKSDDGVLIAGINSFGMAGTNLHLVVQNGFSPEKRGVSSGKGRRGSHLFPISAKDPEALSDLVKLYLAKLKKEEQEVELADFAYSLSTTRTHYSNRLGITASSQAELLSKLANGVSRKRVIMSDGPEPLIFLFTGHGAGLLGHCRELRETSPTFRATFDMASEMMKDILGKSLSDVLWDPEFAQAKDPLYAQPALFCLQYCLWKLWLSFLGDRLKEHRLVVLGHSLGEYAASVAAGFLSFEDGLRLVCSRAMLVAELPEASAGHSGMLAIRSPSSEVASHIEQFLASCNLENAWIDIAAVNARNQTVVSAPLETLDSFKKFLEINAKVATKRLETSVGFHSRLMTPILQAYKETLDKVVFHQRHPNVTYISGLLGQEVTADEVGKASYWTRHLRESVQFSNALESIFGGIPEAKVFIEIGPHSLLLKLVRGDGGTDLVLCPSMHSSDASGWLTLNKSLRRLYENWNGELCWESIYEDSPCSKIDLPNYPFQRKKYWIGVGPSSPRAIVVADMTADIGANSHPLLGERLDLATPSQAMYNSRITLASESYWKDHVVAGTHIIPAASCLEAILNLDKTPLHVTDIRMTKAARLGPSPIHIQTGVTEFENKNRSVEFFFKGKEDQEWLGLLEASISPAKVWSHCEIELSGLLSNNPGLSVTDSYRQLERLGLEYGPAFQMIDRIRLTENASLFQTRPMTGNFPGHVCNPLLLDSMLQSYLLRTINKRPSEILKVPVAIENFTWYGVELGSVELTPYFIHISEPEEKIILADAQGRILATMCGVVLMDTTKEKFLRSLGQSRTMTREIEEEPSWTPSPDLIVEKVEEMGAWKDLDENVLGVVEPGGVPQRRLRYDSLCYKYILRLLVVDGGWSPRVGQSVSPSVLESLFSAYQHGVNVNCFRRFIQVLTEEEFLSYNPTSKDWTVEKELDKQEIAELEDSTFFSSVLNPDEQIELEAQLTQHFGEGLPRVFRNEITPLQHLFNSHPTLHMGMFYGEIPEAVRINQKLADTLEQEVFRRWPEGVTLQILEIGAGTGATTVQILRRLDAVGIQYKYTFTDIGPSFLASAKSKFSTNGDKMSFELLNIEKDPRTQGFLPGSFHVILGANVIHATKNLSLTLQNARTLLASSGYFGLIEVFRADRFTDLTATILDGWWLFEDERGENMGPLMPSRAWIKRLEGNGFRNPVIVGPDPWSYGSIVCRADPSYRSPALEAQYNWILCGPGVGHGKLLKALANQLSGRDPASSVILGLSESIPSETKPERGQFAMDLGTPLDFSRLRNWIKNNNQSSRAFVYVGTEEDDDKEFTDFLQMLTGLDPREMPNRVVLITTGRLGVQQGDEPEGVVPFPSNKLQRTLRKFTAENPEVQTVGIYLDPARSIEETVAQVYSLLWGGARVLNRQILLRSGGAFLSKRARIEEEERQPSTKAQLSQPRNEIENLEALAEKVLHGGLEQTEKGVLLEELLERCLRIHAALPESEGGPLNPNLSMSVFGMDSLMAMEVHMRVSKVLGIKISPDLFLNQKTIRGLANAISPLVST